MDTSGFRNPLPPAGRWKGRSGCSIKGQRQPVVARQGTSCNGKRGGFGGEKCLCHRLEMLSLEEREKRAQVLMVMEPSDHGSLRPVRGLGDRRGWGLQGRELTGSAGGQGWGELGERLCQACICSLHTRTLWLRRGRQDQNRLSELRACSCFCSTVSAGGPRWRGGGPDSAGTVCWGALWAMFLGLPVNPKA